MTVSLADLPVYLKAEAKPAVLNPNEEGRIEFTFGLKKMCRMGTRFRQYIPGAGWKEGCGRTS